MVGGVISTVHLLTSDHWAKLMAQRGKFHLCICMNNHPAPYSPQQPRKAAATLWQPVPGGGQDAQGYITLIPLFFICAFIIYFLLEITLIPLLSASRWLVFFWAIGFLGLYMFREKLRLDLTDGLILSMFGIAPLLMAGILTINYYLSTPFSETYLIEDRDNTGSRTELFLANGAYDDFYRIRAFDHHEVRSSRTITYVFGKGPLWQVMKGNSWQEE